MYKQKIFTLCFVILMFTFCLSLSLSLPASADKSCNNSISPSIAGNVMRLNDFCSNSIIKWDDINSDDEIKRNNICTIAITDESVIGGPYTWSVSGTGFSLENTTTMSLSNTLHANSTACGSATINVTRCSGSFVTGYVRCTSSGAGKWVLKPSLSCNTGYWYGGGGYCCFEYTMGDTKQVSCFQGVPPCLCADYGHTCCNGGIKAGECSCYAGLTYLCDDQYTDATCCYRIDIFKWECQ